MKQWLWGALVVSAGLAWAGDKAGKAGPRPPAGVSWSAQVVRATGAGAPDVKAASKAQARLGAERAAQLDAFRNLLAQVKGISIDGQKKVEDAMARDEVKARVEGVVKGYRIVDKRYYSDLGVEIDVEVPLAALTDVVDPDATPQQLVGKVDAPATTTGLVIDARGLKVTPALAPRLLDEAGKPLYGVDSLSAEARKDTGVASYVQSLDEAKKSLKAGDRPLVLKAERAAGADLTLSGPDAAKLAAMNTGFLAQGRVVIVLN